MTTLRDLCLNTIEANQTDVREVLKEVKDELPKKVWSRHPILTIVGHSALETNDGEQLFAPWDKTEQLYEVLTIKVEYTGVYTVSFERGIDEVEERIEQAEHLVKAHRPDWKSEKWEERYESIGRELTPEDLEEIDAIVAKTQYQPFRNTTAEEQKDLSIKNMKEHRANRHLSKILLYTLEKYCSWFTISLDNPLSGEEVMRVREVHFGEGESYDAEDCIQGGLQLISQFILK